MHDLTFPIFSVNCISVKQIGNFKPSSYRCPQVSISNCWRTVGCLHQSSSHNESTNRRSKVRWNNFYLAQQSFFWLNCQQPWHATVNGYAIGMLIIWQNWIDNAILRQLSDNFASRIMHKWYAFRCRFWRWNMEGGCTGKGIVIGIKTLFHFRFPYTEILALNFVHL